MELSCGEVLETDAAGELTRREKGAFLSSRPALFWYLRISIKALVPGRNLLFRGDAVASAEAKELEQLLLKTFMMETSKVQHQQQQKKSKPAAVLLTPGPVDKTDIWVFLIKCLICCAKALLLFYFSRRTIK